MGGQPGVQRELRESSRLTTGSSIPREGSWATPRAFAALNALPVRDRSPHRADQRLVDLVDPVHLLRVLGRETQQLLLGCRA
jgi:hypothetical protein